ncbi:cobaltochelatase subunit CobN [Phormidesmis priestleyi ULC007]|uniref:Cobaltochelatase subunit CobN n=1 Tax=Phormidesmis priestleyi ULC007 TaxID=1920490 RepID=A0A2T1D846_9CYAN|nr:cobaltochelatase subunit CobN [Phormidesmis priestleyi]PSB16638.1 cobaltochelatase subunit CobN [Phormidesmis priestleyi ULC007]PZO47540.1 MAG: cobaltochelatase subunit CobN [Phormidesmis priestleyi]
MHRLATIPGGWNPAAEGVIFVEQQPAPIVVITAADTDIQTLAAAANQLPDGFASLRVVNLLQLQQQLTIDTYAEDVLSQAEVIIVRVIGGRSYWSYGLEVVEETAKQTGTKLIILPGDERPDPNLMSHSTVSLTEVNQVWKYFLEGGVDNYCNLLKFVSTYFLNQTYAFNSPQPVPRIGIYGGQQKIAESRVHSGVGILFYRAHYLSGNTAVIDAMCDALIKRNLTPVPIFVSSLKEPDVQKELLNYCDRGIGLLFNTTSFSLARLESETPQVELWEMLNVPVFQVIFSGGTQEQWTSGFQGLSPKDIAMNVALPEVDGRIITRAVSFKAVQTQNPLLQTDVVGYEPVLSRIEFVSELAANWIKLRQTPPNDRKVALILANYPTRDGRLANGVGLDTPASCIEILKALKLAGYHVENIPESDKELIKLLTTGVTNDPEGWTLRNVRQSLTVEDYQSQFDQLPIAVQKGIQTRWGLPEEITAFPIPGIQLGNVFVGVQPARGYDRDPSLNYHAPDLEPPHNYLAFYHWIRSQFGANAIVHVGKHGNLEWLPGKSVALSEECYPEAVFGAMPHLYPFIVNDPGEGAQAKRRTQAVIIDHLTPPMTRAELYGNLHQVEGLIDEYYEAQTLDPSRLKLISDRLSQLIIQENLHQDLGIENLALNESSLASFLKTADGYLCELKESQIRDGLHILGQCPQNRQLRDLIVAIARNPSANRLGLTRAIAQDWQLELDPLTADLGELVHEKNYSKIDHCRIIGDVVEVIEEFAADLITQLIQSDEFSDIGAETIRELDWIRDRLLPALQKTDQEILNLLKGLNGQYVPSGASGAPTRGRPEVLPTGRNFYSVDIRAIPTETAWEIGRKAAEALVERYTQENGDYPKTLGLSVWGTSTMRTGGDDIAEALALLGVKPLWDGVSRRVVDFEILPLSAIGRPRVDVTLRISGFFRDAFPNLIDLFDSAVTAVAQLDESDDENPLSAQATQEQTYWESQGLTSEDAKARSLYRIFGSKPSAYGAGLQGVIESQNWTDENDLAQAYINWSAYAYTRKSNGTSAPEAFNQRLNTMQIVLQNQDNREHDLLDSDDYYQFQGGLTAAVKSISGKQPDVYFGDNSRPDQPKVRQLSEEISRVYRARVVNPKWIAGMMRHGYKGAFEMAATIDYLFAYDATTNCVQDFMYQGIAETYLFDPSVQEFIQENNPWAMRDMSERLLEAHQRGLWENASKETLNRLQNLSLEAEGIIENQL